MKRGYDVPAIEAAGRTEHRMRELGTTGQH